MKFLSLLLLILSISCFSQTSKSSGRVYYDFIPKMISSKPFERIKDKNVLAEYIQEYESKNTKQVILDFKGKESFFRKAELIEESNQILSNDGSINVEVRISDAFIYPFYTNLGDEHVIEYKKRKYAVSSKLKPSAEGWVVTNEEKSILGFDCKKAIKESVSTIVTIVNGERRTIEKKNNIIVWFAKELKTPFGPSKYNNFPGLVLQVETSYFSFEATKIDLKETDLKLKIANVKDYQSISLKDYESIRNKD